MTDAYDMTRRWYDHTKGREVRGQLAIRRCPVYSDAEGHIFSYGRHFEMARPLRDRKGEVQAYLINGDTASVTTSRHQGFVRSVLRDEQTVIIPYSALDQAGIDLDSIRILEVREDRWETIRHSSPDWDDVPRERRFRRRGDASYWETGPQAFEAIPRGEDGLYHWETHRHWMGGSLIRARVTWQETVECPHCHGLPMEGPTGQWTATTGREYAEHLPTCGRCRGGGTVTVSKHRWATFLSSFDEQETRPSYFFCELPARSKARTIAEAYEALKPEPVKLAEAMGRAVTRQGDIFAVPTTYTKAQLRKLGAVFERMSEGRVEVDLGWRGKRIEYGEAAQLLGTNHRATEVARIGDVTLARGVLWHKPEGRDPDHKRQPMGDRKGWHVIVKNTVPVAA